MKKWKVTIRVPDEIKAIEYLEKLIEGFKAADKLKQPMDYLFLENKDKKECLTCQLIKKSR